ncbi:hypothetical protein CRYUN_Cryun19dG0128000 [Craigia yunnanensis]
MSMADNYTQPEFVMEITVLSAENLNKPASCGLLSRRLRPFISITNSNGHNPLADCKCDDEKFTFGEKFIVPIEFNFFTNIYSYLCLHIYTKSVLGRQAELGWCRIPATDIGAPPVGSTRHLSYKLLAKDGSKGHGIVNLEVKLLSYGCLMNSVSGQEVIGFPVTVFPPSD